MGLLTVIADYGHIPDMLKMPSMCQEQATVQYFKNMEVMMKIGPRLPLQAGTSNAASTVFLPSRLSIEMGEGQNGGGRKELEASVGSTVID